MKCRNCGKELPENVRYCDACGAKTPTPASNTEQNNTGTSYYDQFDSPPVQVKQKGMLFHYFLVFFGLPLVAWFLISEAIVLLSLISSNTLASYRTVFTICGIYCIIIGITHIISAVKLGRKKKNAVSFLSSMIILSDIVSVLSSIFSSIASPYINKFHVIFIIAVQLTWLIIISKYYDNRLQLFVN